MSARRDFKICIWMFALLAILFILGNKKLSIPVEELTDLINALVQKRPSITLLFSSSIQYLRRHLLSKHQATPIKFSQPSLSFVKYKAILKKILEKV